jgi:hypothetical protein
MALHLPPLGESKEDMPLLTQHFLILFAEKNSKSTKGFTQQAMDNLLKYRWPGDWISPVKRCAPSWKIKKAEQKNENIDYFFTLLFSVNI